MPATIPLVVTFDHRVNFAMRTGPYFKKVLAQGSHPHQYIRWRKYLLVPGSHTFNFLSSEHLLSRKLIVAKAEQSKIIR